MKIKNNLFIITIIAFVCCYGCKSNTTQEEDNLDDSKESLVDTNQLKELYPKILRQLGDSNLDFSTLSLMSQHIILHRRQDDPVNLSNGLFFKSNFELHYLIPNQNVTNLDVEFPLQNFLNTIDHAAMVGHPDWGYSFYPVLLENPKRISLVILKSYRDINNCVKHLPHDASGEVEYHLITEDSHGDPMFQLIDKTDFENLQADYGDLTVLNSFGQPYIIKDLRHPGACFYTVGALNQMFVDNMIDLSQIANVKMVIEHASYGHNNVNPASVYELFHLHSILQTLKVGNQLRVDDQNYPGDYTMRSLDVGYLCPPECPNTCQ